MDVQTRDVSGLYILSRTQPGLIGQCCGVERWIDQHVEGLARAGFHEVAAVELVHADAVEERLVADAPQRVVDAHVDRVHVAGESQAVFQVRLGLVVLDLAGVDPRVQERETTGDAVLLLFEKVQRYGPGVVGV
ncbi:hypothetical protein [Propionibacterium freudenreichii]|uniref:hypothetical protein n=1 Tax=Propionibacterium freudenreichii TaxID=1744 RepID=UPI001E4CD937|nr:hypothetical protein [Propionibacterium freudenreichii]